MDEIDECVFVVEAIDVVLWAKAIRRDTGDDFNMIGLPLFGMMMLPNGAHGHIPVHVLLPPEAARAIVAGIAELIESGEPPPFNLPGSN